MGPVLPYHFPEIILTLTLSLLKISILSLVNSWYAGGSILFALLRLIHNWNPNESY